MVLRLQENKFKVIFYEKGAKKISLKRKQLQREQSFITKKHLTLDEIGRRLTLTNFKEMNIILKGDVNGSVEASNRCYSKHFYRRSNIYKYYS